MKKTIAMLLALMLALSGTLSLAEGMPMAFPELTLESALHIDREAAAGLMATFGLQENQIALADKVLAVLDAVGEKVVLADVGLQYDLKLNDAQVFSLGGELTDNGLAIASTLFPHYVLTASPESLMKVLNSIMETVQSAQGGDDMDPSAQAKIGEYAQQFVETAMGAIQFGEPESGEFEMGETTYNTRLLIDVDSKAIVEALKVLVDQVTSDETVMAALQAAQGVGVDLSEAENASENLDPENAPAIAATYYTNIDEEGNLVAGSYTAIEVTEVGKEAPNLFIDVAQAETGLAIEISAPENAVTVTVNFGQEEKSFFARLDADIQGIYLGLDGIVTMADAGMDIDFALYVLDSENPLLTANAKIAFEGERTLTVQDEGKTAVAIEALLSEDGAEADNTAAMGLMMDVMINGLGGAVGTATEAVPEIADLINLFSGSQEDADVGADEAIPAAGDAA